MITNIIRRWKVNPYYIRISHPQEQLLTLAETYLLSEYRASASCRYPGDPPAWVPATLPTSLGLSAKQYPLRPYTPAPRKYDSPPGLHQRGETESKAPGLPGHRHRTRTIRFWMTSFQLLGNRTERLRRLHHLQSRNRSSVAPVAQSRSSQYTHHTRTSASSARIR